VEWHHLIIQLPAGLACLFTIALVSPDLSRIVAIEQMLDKQLLNMQIHYARAEVVLLIFLENLVLFTYAIICQT
jgi:hypothetical protein